MKYLLNDEFVDAWLKAHAKGMNQSELAEELGLTRQAVSQRAHKMKKEGVNLPRLNSIPVEELNRKLNAVERV